MSGSRPWGRGCDAHLDRDHVGLIVAGIPVERARDVRATCAQGLLARGGVAVDVQDWHTVMPVACFAVVKQLDLQSALLPKVPACAPGPPPGPGNSLGERNQKSHGGSDEKACDKYVLACG